MAACGTKPGGTSHDNTRSRHTRSSGMHCGLDDHGLPQQPILVAASLPTGLDLFRLRSFPTVLIGSERFVQAFQRLELVFTELPLR